MLTSIEVKFYRLKSYRVYYFYEFDPANGFRTLLEALICAPSLSEAADYFIYMNGPNVEIIDIYPF